MSTIGNPSAFTKRCDTCHLPRQAFNTDTDRGPKGKGRLKRVCGLRRLESPTIERVRRAPARGSGVATTRARRTTPSSFLA